MEDGSLSILHHPSSKSFDCQHCRSNLHMIEITNATPLLSGYRVLDLSSSMGSFCGKVLRDLGMEVIKIEPPGGDAGRLEPPFAKGHAHREGSLRFAYLNGGKKSITLDIAKDSGRKIFLDLVAKSDIVLETFEPGDLAARGLGYAQLAGKAQQADLGFAHRFRPRRPLRALQSAGYRRQRHGRACSTLAAIRR